MLYSMIYFCVIWVNTFSCEDDENSMHLRVKEKNIVP